MTTLMLERPEDGPAIETLIDTAFGAERFKKTVYKFRDGVPPIPALCFVAYDVGKLVGSLRFWPILVNGDTEAILLGPLAVDPARRGEGIGVALMWHGLAEAQRQGHRIVILVGDYDYYAKFGFRREPCDRLDLPGWVDRKRFLARGLVPGAVDNLSGMIEKWVPEAERRKDVA
ncbi:N-acetyltransferase [Oleomonas cavernae]|uniref:N-acetyltransferase n=1 Tax=Oleomonas cavernae TaxID=2320859 RepID=A0A418WCT8_9PROT|nr:N-acetyltransferase [Oleomonas cavernae]RJF87804.1 N-acetyltransferase [Oleomonas cavernae]